MGEYRQLDQSEPIARKQHRCIWCGEMIESGERYRREKSAYYGALQNHAWHLECAKDRYAGLEHGDDNEFTPYSADRPKKDQAHG